MIDDALRLNSVQLLMLARAIGNTAEETNQIVRASKVWEQIVSHIIHGTKVMPLRKRTVIGKYLG